MNERTTTPLPIILFTLLFVLLFHEQALGLNVLLFEAPLLAWLWWYRRPPRSLEVLLTTGGTLLSAVLVVLHGSDLARWVNGLSLVLAVGVLLAPQLHAVHHALLLGLHHVWPAQRAFFRSLGTQRTRKIMPRMGRNTFLSLLAVAAVLFGFSQLYRMANPHFHALVGRLEMQLAMVFDQLDLGLVLTGALGLLTTNLVLQRSQHPRLMAWMGRSHAQLLRRGEPGRAGNMLGLRYELRSGERLLGLLNVLVLVANVLDIRHVWFGFSFNGQYLKQFVHEGTYLLILSIALGAGIVLWFFRANQNFHRSNRTLKVLAYGWLAQNVVLAISVGIRNYWYIHHYALAYKRIGVVFFLLAVIVGLVMVGMKVRHLRSRHFLLRWNAFAIHALLLAMACVNWDLVIARYNFSKQEQAFVHLDFMATLSDKTLPWLHQEQHALERIDRHNQRMLDSGRFSRTLYMEPQSYGEVITERTGRFLDQYPKRSWQSWNLADARAYKKLAQR